MKQKWLIFTAFILTLSMLAACAPAPAKMGQTKTEAATTEKPDAAEAATTEAETTMDGPQTALSAPPPTDESAADEGKTGETEALTVRVGMLMGPTAMGAVQFMDESKDGQNKADDPIRYEWSLMAAVDEIAPKLLKGELDISAVPSNLASVLYNNSKGNLVVLAVNTLGVLYLVENQDSIHSMADLRGKTILASGKGATPEYALHYLLRENGLDPEKDLTVEWKAEHAECAAALAAEENAIAILPQPFVTVAQSKNERIRIALNLSEEWEKVQKDKENASALIMGVVVARRDFLNEHPEAIRDFLDRYRRSVSYVRENTEKAAELVASFGIVPAPVAKKALPYCNIVFMDGAEMKTKLAAYLAVLYEQNPKAVGGQLPKDDFYYSSNP